MKNLKGKEIPRQAIINAMRSALDNCVDDCGEVDCTKLAETAASELDLYEDAVTYKIPEEVFDIAIEVNEKYG